MPRGSRGAGQRAGSLPASRKEGRTVVVYGSDVAEPCSLDLADCKSAGSGAGAPVVGAMVVVVVVSVVVVAVVAVVRVAGLAVDPDDGLGVCDGCVDGEGGVERVGEVGREDAPPAEGCAGEWVWNHE